MKINVIKRKASSYRNLSQEEIEVGNPINLLELLMNVMEYQIKEVYKDRIIIDDNEIEDELKSGKVQFTRYGNKPNLENMKDILIQDFNDGLFRVYINDEEYTDLYKNININNNDTLVIVKLVMLTGRLW